VTQPSGERICVALVHGLHGLRGAVRVEVLSDAADRFAPGTVLYVEGESSPLTIAWTGPSKPGLLLRFAEVTSREAAERLRDRYLEVVPEAALPEGTYYWHEIVGLEARTADGEWLGTVREVFRAGAGEVYVVDGGPRGEILVPAVRAVVSELSPALGRLVIDAAAMELPPVPDVLASDPDAVPAGGGQVPAGD
jgi:16S rRNA processing protein RimM